MAKKDQLDKFVEGSEEMNKKRRTIKMVMIALADLLYEVIRWHDLAPDVDHRIFKAIVPQEDATKVGYFYVRAMVTSPKAGILYRKDLSKKREINLFYFIDGLANWSIREGTEHVPATYIPALRESLEDIVNTIDATFPKAGIWKHFDFFIKQAPSE